MRIAFILDWHLYYTTQLINGFDENHEILLITRDHNFEISSPDNPVSLDEFLERCIKKNIVRDKLRYRLRSLKNVPEILRIFRVIKSFNPDTVHIQENTDWRIFLITKLIGMKKTVLTLHDVLPHPGDPGRVNRAFWFFLWKRVRRVIVHGEFLRQQLLSRSEKLKDKVRVVPLGVHSIHQEWDSDPVDEEENSILFFGRMSRYKGLNILVEAEPLIARELPEVNIILAGRGPELDRLEDSLKQKKSFEVHNRFISNAEVSKFFRRAAAVVVPYIEASQSGVVAVAYAYAKPVVVTNVGSIPEVVDNGKTGFVVPSNDPAALADAIVKILKNQELRESMKQNALLKASTDLSWENIAIKTVEVYTSL